MTLPVLGNFGRNRAGRGDAANIAPGPDHWHPVKEDATMADGSQYSDSGQPGNWQRIGDLARKIVEQAK